MKKEAPPQSGSYLVPRCANSKNGDSRLHTADGAGYGLFPAACAPAPWQEYYNTIDRIAGWCCQSFYRVAENREREKESHNTLCSICHMGDCCSKNRRQVVPIFSSVRSRNVTAGGPYQVFGEIIMFPTMFVSAPISAHFLLESTIMTTTTKTGRADRRARLFVPGTCTNPFGRVVFAAIPR
jgi:hypothetical protein